MGERKGSNGLFTEEGQPIILSKIAEEIDCHTENVWGLIFSLKREDAERLGYNSAVQWMNLPRSHRNDVAKEMGIEPENLRWYAAYHNEASHPHAHMLVWSKNPQEPYLSTVGIENIKKAVAKDIFRQDNMAVYKEQTYARDSLKENFRLRVAALSDEIYRDPVIIPPELIQKFEMLSAALEKHKGKKVYGYLNKGTKIIVDDIVKMIAQDEKIAELYELWYQLQCETYRIYTDKMPFKIPIEENKEFKSIRNFVTTTARPSSNAQYYRARCLSYCFRFGGVDGWIFPSALVGR